MIFMFYVVATPIGNLEDMSFRAVRVLKEADLILCEDTRVTRVLLAHFGIITKTISYHQHSGAMKHEKIAALLAEGRTIAMVCDAGTPGLSDPGGRLVAYLYENGLKDIAAIPGPSAVSAALSISGFPADNFLFLGFMPNKKGKLSLMKKIADEQKTVVFYESKHRIRRTLSALEQHIGSRSVFVGRELTKKFEQVYRGTIREILGTLLEKGEFVVIVEGK